MTPAELEGASACPGRRARGVWKVSELQRMLAARGMVISAEKMSGLWSGQPNTVRLDELDVICAVLGCGVAELLLPEPETVPQPALADGERPAADVAEGRPATPRRPRWLVTRPSLTRAWELMVVQDAGAWLTIQRMP